LQIIFTQFSRKQKATQMSGFVVNNFLFLNVIS